MRLTPPLRQGATATRCAPRWPTARSTRWCPTTTRSAEDMKNLPFGEAEPGATGLELLLSLALRWGQDRACRCRRRWRA
jgi:dihydroorotase